MTVFLTLMVIGLTGLVMMAIPGFSRHGHGMGASHTGHGIGHAGHGGLHIGQGHGAAHAGHAAAPAHGTHGASQGDETAGAAASGGAIRFLPPLRVIFSLLALYGAFGYALGAYLPSSLAALIAVPPAYLLERFAVTPFWNLLFQFQGQPDTPLENLVLTEAEAVTPFHNGRGIVSVVRDGRQVQFSARLPESQATMPIRVGDKLRVEEVDAANERVIVTLH